MSVCVWHGEGGNAHTVYQGDSIPEWKERARRRSQAQAARGQCDVEDATRGSAWSLQQPFVLLHVPSHVKVAITPKIDLTCSRTNWELLDKQLFPSSRVLFFPYLKDKE